MLISGATTQFAQVSEIRRKLGIGPLAAGVPIGGATNTVLAKLSPLDYNTGWAALLGGLITAGNGIVFAGNTVHYAQVAAYTAGAIPFATGAATMGFDTANLFWDNTNKRLGIGTNAPSAFLHLTPSTAATASLCIPRGTAAYTGTVEGDFWNDYTQHCLVGYLAGLKQFDSRTLFVQTESVTVGNSDVETSLFGAGVGTLTLPVNFWTVGKNLRIRLSGFWASNALSDFRIRVYLGAINVWDSGVQSLVGSTWSAKAWKLDVDSTCRTTGAGGTEIAQGFFLGISGTAVGSVWTMPSAVETATTGIDTTAVMAVNVTITWSAADAADTITCTNATVKILA